MKSELIQAIDQALGGDWDGAHRIVQELETDPVASWIHAVLHKIEGDDSNSRYWYRRADQMSHVNDDPNSELQEIRRLIDDDQ